MDYTIKLINIFNPETWMVDKKVKSFLRKTTKKDLILLIDDKIPNIPPLLTIFKSYDKKQPWEFLGENPVYLLCPNVEYDGLRKIITPRIKNPEDEKIAFHSERKIVYIPDRLHYGTDAVNALRNEEGHNMKEFRIYAELIRKNIMGIEWDYFRNLLKEISA